MWKREAVERGAEDVMHVLRALAAAMSVMVSASALGCGANDSSPRSEINVGSSAIAVTMVDHWSAVLDGGRADLQAARAKKDSLRKQAADTLVDAAWLEGEAKQLGVAATAREIENAISRKITAEFPGGRPEYRTYLSQIGETPADARLVVEKELNAGKLRAWAIRGKQAVSVEAVARYYHRHLAQYRVPEERLALITNRKSKDEGEQARRNELSGGNMIPAKQSKAHELWVTVHTEPRDHNSLEGHIYAARRGELVGPFKWGADYILFKVLKITPAGYKPLKDVEAGIRQQLEHESEMRALATFVAGWRQRWRIKTTCRPGLVISKCSEYHGNAREAAYSFT